MELKFPIGCQVEYEQYLQKLSSRRKKYQQEHGYVFTHREHTQLELRFQKFLEGHGINFISQHVLQGKKFDFFCLICNY